ncbi:3-phosphoshikimate 1-carboxyvinyltransferase [Bacteroidota bacterium]
MKKSIQKSIIKGEIVAPPSKSLMIRALTGALMSEGFSVILNPIICNDTSAAIDIIKSLGANVEQSSESILIKGALHKEAVDIDCIESALCARLFSAIAPLLAKDIRIIGKGSLLNRNLSDVTNNLISLGIICESSNGRLPFSIKGDYKINEIKVDCSKSSQFLTGLLFALPLCNHDTIINVDNLISKPYINLTIDILCNFGIKIEHKEFKRFYIEGNQKYTPVNIIIEGDWSNSAFLLVAGAIAGNVSVKGLNINSMQGDKNILEILDKAGAYISIKEDSIQIMQSKLTAFEFDLTDTPDLFPPIVSLACYCNGVSKIHGANRLVNKESNRLNALISEFSKLAVKIFLKENTLFIEGGKLKGCDVDSHNDHRIAMALTIAGLTSEEPIIINNAECISKSYPSFYDDMKILGGNIHE